MPPSEYSSKPVTGGSDPILRRMPCPSQHRISCFRQVREVGFPGEPDRFGFGLAARQFAVVFHDGGAFLVDFRDVRREGVERAFDE